MALQFHPSFGSLLDSFRNVIAALTWLKAGVQEAKKFYANFPHIITLPCSVTSEEVFVDKSILTLVEKEGFNQPTPLFTDTLINFYRVFTMAIKDIVWEETDFQGLLERPELQFLRHIRNASAHDNSFYWGSHGQGKNVLGKLPAIWRGKEIKEELEGTPLYMEFLNPVICSCCCWTLASWPSVAFGGTSPVNGGGKRSMRDRR